jgi:kynurenine 3-monooxygenase
MEKHALHIWPRGGFMLIALPNADGSFTCTLFAAYEGPDSFESLLRGERIIAFFQRHFPDVAPLLPDLVEQFCHNPTGPLVTIRCRPWHVEGRAVLIGDACHAVVPFLGQGMNAAFEDCSVLVQCLERHKTPLGCEDSTRGFTKRHPQGVQEAGEALRNPSGVVPGKAPGGVTRGISSAFAEYEQLRKPHLDALAELCVDNFLEMRDRVGSRWFVLKKKLAVLLHKALPGWYVPLYTMVEFTRIPYAEAVRRARKQDRVVAILLLTVLLVACLLVALNRGG